MTRWPLPPDYETRLATLRQAVAGGTRNYLADALDPSSEFYGYVNVNSLIYQGWWDAVGAGFVPPTLEGAATYIGWLQPTGATLRDVLNGSKPTWRPTEIENFLTTLPQNNTIYQQFDSSERGGDAGLSPTESFARREGMLRVLGFMRKAAYVQSAGAPPSLLAWELSGTDRMTANFRSIGDKIAFLVKALGERADDLAIGTAKIRPPFGGITPTDLEKLYWKTLGYPVPDSATPIVGAPTGFYAPPALTPSLTPPGGGPIVVATPSPTGPPIVTNAVPTPQNTTTATLIPKAEEDTTPWGRYLIYGVLAIGAGWLFLRGKS